MICVLLLAGLGACQTVSSVTPSILPVVNLQTASPAVTNLPAELRVTPGVLEDQYVMVWVPWLDDRSDQLGYLVEDFNRSNEYGIQVNLTGWGGESALMDGLTAAADQGGLPDVFLARPEEAFRLQSAGMNLVEMDDYMASQVWGYDDDEKADLIEPVWRLGQNDGVQYGIPAEVNAHFLVYNLTWGLELGFNAPPRTREQFLLQSCKAQKANLDDNVRENNGTGGWLVASDAASLLAWLASFDFEIQDGSPDVFNTPEAVSGFDYLKNLVARDCAWLGKAETPYDYFARRYALFYSGSLADIAAQRAALTSADSADQWVLIPYPEQSTSDGTLVDGTTYFILSSDYTRQMASWIFLRWLNEPGQQQRILQVYHGWPTRLSMLETFTDGFDSDIVYTYVRDAMKTIQPIPHDKTWSIARRIFEDATWQLFQPETLPDRIPGLLEELDRTIQEILSMGDD
ncbi:MAG: extracellular solute-binding protein [Anaerolineaceae bacterium]|nr:extracellular solute-binding protein [Anaerolineaceae bacterium]MBN2677239.1 extracellular solute-binding protein [Anaerolineaceae bacterium]